MHAGSVEGLSWDHNTGILVSCSSDCTINIYSMTSKKYQEIIEKSNL